MADLTYSTRQKFRVGGSGFTAFYWNGQVIGFAQNVTVRSPSPVTNPVPIQPMDARYPLQIITPGAITEGYLDVGLLELYKTKVWDRLIKAAMGPDAAPANDLADVFFAMASTSTPINAVKMIIPPQNLQGDAELKPYGEIYHNCVITAIDDGETVDVRTMEIVKNVTIAYTHATRTGNDVGAVGAAAGGWGTTLYPSNDPYRGGFQDQ